MSDVSPGSRFLVLVTGYAAAGKTTIAPLLAKELEALWISHNDGASHAWTDMAVRRSASPW